jgi:hypothetical protein
VRSELALAVAEDPVANGEFGHARADDLDIASELGAKDGGTGPGQPGQQPHDGGPCRPIVTIRPVHRCRPHPDQQLAVARRWLLHGGDPDDGRRAVPSVNRSLHA